MVVIDLSTAFDNLCYLKTTKPRYLQQSYSLVRNLSHKQTTIHSCGNFIVRTTHYYTRHTSRLNSWPTLFSLCMNDLPKVIKFSNIKSCVDDTKIYLSFTSKDIDSCLCQVAEDLKHVSEWYYANHLLINPETKIVCPVWGEATYLQVAQ